jgi:hypothetical protein
MLQKGALPEKMHQGPADSKAAPGDIGVELGMSEGGAIVGM